MKDGALAIFYCINARTSLHSLYLISFPLQFLSRWANPKNCFLLYILGFIYLFGLIYLCYFNFVDVERLINLVYRLSTVLKKMVKMGNTPASGCGTFPMNPSPEIYHKRNISTSCLDLQMYGSLDMVPMTLGHHRSTSDPLIYISVAPSMNLHQAGTENIELKMDCDENRRWWPFDIYAYMFSWNFMFVR